MPFNRYRKDCSRKATEIGCNLSMSGDFTFSPWFVLDEKIPTISGIEQSERTVPA